MKRCLRQRAASVLPAMLPVLLLVMVGVGLGAPWAALAGSTAATPPGGGRYEVPWDFTYKDAVPAVRQTLAQTAAALEQSPSAVLEILGHTWNRGGDLLNRRLSQRQAEMLRQQLIREFHIDSKRIVARGLGSDEPRPGLAERDSANRRLELILHDRTPRTAPAAPPAVTTAATAATAPASPAAPAVCPLPAAGRPASSFTLHFGKGRNTIHPESVEALKQVASLLQAWPMARAMLVGHADNRGDPARNLTLSAERAETVRQALHVAFGIPLERMCVEGAGDAQPVEDNTSAAGRARNRRVEVLLEGVGEAGALAQAPPSPSTPAPAPRLFVVDGGVTAAGPSSQKYYIEISVHNCTLWLYERQEAGDLRLVKEYRVATAKNGMDHPEGLGYVTKIDKNPWWYPTPDMKRRAAAKGQALGPVPPGRKSNPMGVVKIHLSHGPTYRIHGTNRPDQIGRRVSLGCIRMLNQDALELANLIDVGAEVNVVF